MKIPHIFWYFKAIDRIQCTVDFNVQIYRCRHLSNNPPKGFQGSFEFDVSCPQCNFKIENSNKSTSLFFCGKIWIRKVLNRICLIYRSFPGPDVDRLSWITICLYAKATEIQPITNLIQ